MALLRFPNYKSQEFDCIYILCSLIGAQEHMAKTIENNINQTCKFLSIHNKQEWSDAWNEIEIDCKKSQIPFIHIVSHGEMDGIRISPSGDKIEWLEVLKQFAKVNGLCEKKLCINMQVCFGAHCITPALTMEEMPFSVLIASPNEIDLCKSLLATKHFYKMFENAGLEDAIENFITEYESYVVNDTYHNSWIVYVQKSTSYPKCMTSFQVTPSNKNIINE